MSTVIKIGFDETADVFGDNPLADYLALKERLSVFFDLTHYRRKPRQAMHREIRERVARFLTLDSHIRRDLHIRFSHSAHLILPKSHRKTTKTSTPLSTALARFFTPADLTDSNSLKDAYRRLLKVHHPDVGGEHDAMVALNAAFARAQEVIRRPSTAVPETGREDGPQPNWSTTKHVLHRISFQEEVPPFWFGISTWGSRPHLCAFEPEEIDGWLEMFVLSIDIDDGEIDGAFQRFDRWLCAAPHRVRPRHGVWRDTIMVRDTMEIGLRMAKAYRRVGNQAAVDGTAELLQVLAPLYLKADLSHSSKEIYYRGGIDAVFKYNLECMMQKITEATRFPTDRDQEKMRRSRPSDSP